MQRKRHWRPRLLARLVKESNLSQYEGESLVLDVAKDLWCHTDTPTSLGLYLCAKYGDLLAVLDHTVDPKDYTSPEAFGLDYQAVSFLKKCPLSVFPLEKRVESAKKKFFEAEDRCAETNSRFRSRLDGDYGPSPVEAVLHSATRKISSWLGEAPKAAVWLSLSRFGPGADDCSSGAKVGSLHKLCELSATADFSQGALSMALDHPVWARGLAFPKHDPFEIDSLEGQCSKVRINLVPGNKVVFVPKNGKIERSIAVEPRMNVYAQLGLGAYLRALLKTRARLNLNTQDTNQCLAHRASRLGHLATIDLSSASDTISIELVRELLPPGWFTAMDWCRSKIGSLDGKTFRYEKFSSMGNGYTFELESLIFLALTLAVCETVNLPKEEVTVYGDDIVCPVGAVALLGEVFSYCGFSINTDKSFTTGVFRESCGKDFFDGTNVRPHFCKEVPTDVKSLYNLANGIRLAGFRRNHGFGCDRRLRPAWLRTVRRIAEPLRHLASVPLIRDRAWGFDIEAGDGGLVLFQDEFLSSSYVRYARDYQNGFYFGTVVAVAWEDRVTDYDASLIYTYALYRSKDGLADGTKPGIVSGRGAARQRVTLRAYTRSYEDIGPWI